MEYKAKITPATFKTDDGKSIEYYDISINVNGQDIKVVPVTSDKKLLKYLLSK